MRLAGVLGESLRRSRVALPPSGEPRKRSRGRRCDQSSAPSSRSTAGRRSQYRSRAANLERVVTGTRGWVRALIGLVLAALAVVAVWTVIDHLRHQPEAARWHLDSKAAITPAS